jgi:uncharacterized membrane protein YfcA
VTVLAVSGALLVVALGAAVQGSVGFGAALIAAPVLALIDPRLVPAPVIVTGLVLNLLMVRRERAHARWRDVSWPIGGLVPGSVAGAALLAVAATTRQLGVLTGLMILVAVALSAWGLHPRPTPATLLGAGTLAGFMQSTVGAGGPPIVLVLQDEQGPVLRSTLSRFFVVSCAVSLVILTLFGQIDDEDLAWSLALIPGTVAGFTLSGWTARHVDGPRMRVAVLSLSAAAGAVVLVRALL